MQHDSIWENVQRDEFGIIYYSGLFINILWCGRHIKICKVYVSDFISKNREQWQNERLSKGQGCQKKKRRANLKLTHFYPTSRSAYR
jgi:hypothetical protein